MDVWEKNSNQEEVLVPIKIHVETDGIRFRDEFTWNLNGNSI